MAISQKWETSKHGFCVLGQCEWVVGQNRVGTEWAIRGQLVGKSGKSRASQHPSLSLGAGSEHEGGIPRYARDRLRHKGIFCKTAGRQVGRGWPKCPKMSENRKHAIFGQQASRFCLVGVAGWLLGQDRVGHGSDRCRTNPDKTGQDRVRADRHRRTTRRSQSPGLRRKPPKSGKTRDSAGKRADFGLRDTWMGLWGKIGSAEDRRKSAKCRRKAVKGGGGAGEAADGRG